MLNEAINVDLARMVTEAVQLKLSPLAYKNWISPLTFEVDSDGVFCVKVPNAFHMENVKRRYLHVIETALREGDPLAPERPIKVFVCSDVTKLAQEPKESKKPAPEAPQPSCSNSTNIPHLPDLKLHKAAPAHCASNDMLIRVMEDFSKNRDNYDFVYVYGGLGAGKTACLKHFYQHLKQTQKVRATYITIDEFTSNLVYAIQQHKVSDFRNKFKDNHEVIFIDDFHMIANRSKTQEELAHLLQSWKNKQIKCILVSQLPLNDVVCNEHLKSRLESGLCVPVRAPDFQYLEHVAQQEMPTLDAELRHVLLSHSRGAIQSLHTFKGILNRMRVEISLCGKTLTEKDIVAIIHEIVPSQFSKEEKTTTPAEIIHLICQYYHIEPEAISSKSRKKALNEARKLCIYLLRKRTSLSLADIGDLVGRDHTTVLHALQKTQDMLAHNCVMTRHLRFFDEKLVSGNGPSFPQANKESIIGLNVEQSSSSIALPSTAPKPSRNEIVLH